MPQAGGRRFLRVEDWDRIQNPKKPEYPPWTRLHRDWLSDYRFMQLSMAERGFLMCMHMLAAECANQIPYDCRWISNRVSYRPQLVGVSLSTLLRLGFVSEFVADTDASKVKHLSRIAGTQRVQVEGEGEGDTDKEKREESSRGTSSSTNGHDPRPFEVIIDNVQKIIRRTGKTDPSEVFRLGGAGLRLSEAQCREAVNQLRQRGEI